jgi:hypothetical protein
MIFCFITGGDVFVGSPFFAARCSASNEAFRCREFVRPFSLNRFQWRNGTINDCALVASGFTDQRAPKDRVNGPIGVVLTYLQRLLGGNKCREGAYSGEGDASWVDAKPRRMIIRKRMEDGRQHTRQ